MNQTQLASFRAVAREGGFSKGAETLMVSQPAVSLQVAELEAALGAKLFDRLPRGVRLTSAGEMLLGYAEQISGLHDEARRAIDELRGLKRGRLVIGASLTVGSYILPPVLGEFHRRYPAVELELEIANTEEIHRKLLSNGLDIGFTEGLAEHEQLQSTVFYADRLVPIAPPGHPILLKRRVTAAQFCREPLIMREKGSGTRAVVEQAMKKRGLQIAAVMSMGSTEAIKRAVISGVGLAIISELAIEAEVKAGMLTVVRVPDLSILRPLHRLELRQRARGFAVREFLSLLPTPQAQHRPIIAPIALEHE